MIRFLTAGESHGPMLTAVLDGIPAGLPLTADEINRELRRRQEGYGSGGRMNIEQDTVQITAGVMAGQTTGAPIAMLVENRDYRNWREKDIAPMTTPRPGHADLTGAIKYGYRDLRVALERASARETTMRVAAGAICLALLRQFGITIGAYVVQIGDVQARIAADRPLEEQIRRAETFLRDHLQKGVQLGKTMARIENFEYPLEAARELVVNAVAHRDYSITGDGIRLFLFRDRMEVTSAGGLPGPVTIANIKDERFSRNPIIVQVLSDMGFIERLGYGVDRVFDLMREQSMRAPEFEETAGGFRVTLFNQIEPPPAPEAAAEPEAPALPQWDGTFRGVSINIRQEAALTFLHGGSTRITNSDLQGLCPDVHPETIRRDLADLVHKGILRKLGEKRGSYYILKPEE